MAARVLEFQPAQVRTAGVRRTEVVSPEARTARQISTKSYKVLPIMFSLTHTAAHDASRITAPSRATGIQDSSMLHKVQGEWADRYVEVEVEGLSFRRLACIYLAAFRQTRLRMLQGVRSIFHLNPAH